MVEEVREVVKEEVREVVKEEVREVVKEEVRENDEKRGMEVGKEERLSGR